MLFNLESLKNIVRVVSRDRFDAVSIANMEGKIALQEFLTLDIFPVAKVINTFILYAVHLTFEFLSELILVIICNSNK